MATKQNASSGFNRIIFYHVFLFPMLWLAGISWAVAAPTNTLIRIALLSDIHINSHPTNEQVVFIRHFEQAITMINTSAVALAVIAGDLTEHGQPKEFAAFKEMLAGVKCPVMYVPGNHDVGGKTLPNHKAGLTPKRIKAYESVLGPSSFVHEMAGVRVIGINSSLLGSGLPEEEQLWQLLEKELAQPANKPTILLMHYPPFLENPDEAGGNYFNIEPAPRQRLLDLAYRGGVTAVFSGHTHHSLSHRLHAIEFITTPPTSFGLPRGQQREGWMLITLTPQGAVRSEIKTLEE